MPKRKYIDRKQSKAESIREQIAVSKAIDVVNAVVAGEPELNGKKIKQQQAVMAWKVIDKMLPSLQAVHIDAQVNHVQTMQDVNVQLMLAGIDPKAAWKLLDRDPIAPAQIINNEENQQLAIESDPTHPPEAQ